MKTVCIDTGVLSLLFSSNPTKPVQELLKWIQAGDIHAMIPKPVLIEAFLNICRLQGKEIAKIAILNFIAKYPIEMVEFDNDLLILAGQLKCQHRLSLSYIDCMGIALALSRKAAFHTTEKRLKIIPHNVLSKLKVVKYTF